MTIMQKAFENAGLRAEDNVFDKAIALYLNSGGTIDRARARVEVAAKRMPGVDHLEIASNGQSGIVQTRQPVGDGGAHEQTPQGQKISAPPSSPNLGQGADFVPSSPTRGAMPSAREPVDDRGGGSLVCRAPKSHIIPAPPVREPSAAYLKAMGQSRLESARSILYRYKTSTGTFWGDVHPYEIGGMSRDHIRGVALLSVLGPLNSKQMKMTFAQLMTPKQAQLAMEKADKELINVA